MKTSLYVVIAFLLASLLTQNILIWRSQMAVRQAQARAMHNLAETESMQARAKASQEEAGRMVRNLAELRGDEFWAGVTCGVVACSKQIHYRQNHPEEKMEKAEMSARILGSAMAFRNKTFTNLPPVTYHFVDSDGRTLTNSLPGK